MPVFSCKEDFLSLGMTDVKPSPSRIAQDCPICIQPLAVHEKDGSPKSRLRGYHDTIRITACGHTHGKDCLKAWLDVGNTCPTCKRILFEFTGDPITQRDIHDLTYGLGPMYGEARVNVALVNMMQKQEREHAALRLVHEQEIARQKMRDAKGFAEEFLLSDGDLMDSEDEMDFGVDDDDDDGDYMDEEGDEEEEEEEEDEEKKHDSAH